MAFYKKKALFIGLGIAGAVIVILAIIGGVGYSKAGSLIKSFEEDYKKVTGNDNFKKIITALENLKIAFFRFGEDTFFLYPYVKNEESKVKIIKEALNKKNKDELLEWYKLKLMRISIDTSKFEKVIGDIDFLAKIGLWFKGKHVIKPILALSLFMHKNIRKTKKNEVLFTVFSIVDDLVAKVFTFKQNRGIGIKNISSAKIFKFEPLKEIITGKSINFIVFIALKVMES